MRLGDPSKPPKFTAKQGQYLACIYYRYTMLHRKAPAETDLQEYFQVSPLTVHPKSGSCHRGKPTSAFLCN